MSVLHPYRVRCTCGATFEVLLAESVNAGRMPKVRAAILAGTFHRFSCPTCRRSMTIEKEFQYTDLQRNTFIKVKPPNLRHLWREVSAELDDDVRLVPMQLAHTDGRTLRVVFGIGELREKLLAEDAGIDDRLTEILKVLLIHEHPFLLTRARLRLQLEGIDEDQMTFVAAYEHSPQRFRLDLPRWIVDGVIEHRGQIVKWLAERHGQASIFGYPRDHWFNLWRWSPQVSALAALKQYAEMVRNGANIDTNSKEFGMMISFLPRGTQLPSWAKRDVQSLFHYAKTNGLHQLQDAIFELRFDLKLDDDWGRNDDPEDIATLWQLLADLPDTNVEGNSKIREILLDQGTGGGSYQPSTYDITIGEQELANKERFQDVVRHEIGHAVHEKFVAVIDPWLSEKFGWHTLGTSDTDIDAWVELMGGWKDLSSIQRAQVRAFLRSALGPGGSWLPGPTPTPPLEHPWWRDGFGPRLAFEKTGAYWYQNHANWYRVDDRAFAMNYYYRTLMVVNESTLKLIDKMPSPYAAMSHFEFFAELYALYYDLDDPLHKFVPANVAKWLEKNIGPSMPTAAAAPAPIPAAPPGPLPEWHWITRPE